MGEGLTANYLENLGKKHCKHFLGVFSCNMHPNIENCEIFSVIFNESRHNEEGTHFVCVFAKKNVIYYFDSLGLKCENDYIIRFLNSSGREIIEIRKQIQSFESVFCGFFSLSFILCMCKNISEINYVKMFNTKNLKLNDIIVVDLIIKILSNDC